MEDLEFGLENRLKILSDTQGYPHRSMKDSSAECDLTCEVPVQEVSKRKNISK